MSVLRWMVCCGPLFLLSVVAAIPVRAAEEAVFEMEQVSPFPEIERDSSIRLAYGQSAHCERSRVAQLKRPRQLKSTEPYYGVLRLVPRPDSRERGRELGFVLDESRGTGKGYDRLWLDTDHDGDLNNEQVRKPMTSPPPGALPRWSANRKVAFDYVTVKLDHGPDLGMQPCRILPLFIGREGGYAEMRFIPAFARKGRIRIGGQEFDAMLGQQHGLTARYDHRSVALYLTPVGGPDKRERWWGADTLSAMRCVNGKYYTLSASPGGDKLTVRSYDGDLGVFEIGPGKRDLKTVGIAGSLRSETTAVGIGQIRTGQVENVRRTSVPVGDYHPAYLLVEYDRLKIMVSNNYHADGGSRRGPAVNGVKIRKDRPFVLDFSNKPEVMFARPKKQQKCSLGQQLRVEAVLIDPVLDIMVRRLDDTSRKVTKTYKSRDGKTQTYERNLSLDPKVTVTNSKGKIVAEGTMPFG